MKIAVIAPRDLQSTKELVCTVLSLSGHLVVTNHFSTTTFWSGRSQLIMEQLDFRLIEEADAVVFVDSHYELNPMNKNFVQYLGGHTEACIVLAKQLNKHIDNYQAVFTGRYTTGPFAVFKKFPVLQKEEEYLQELMNWIQKVRGMEPYIPNENTEALLKEAGEQSDYAATRTISDLPVSESGSLCDEIPLQQEDTSTDSESSTYSDSEPA